MVSRTGQLGTLRRRKVAEVNVLTVRPTGRCLRNGRTLLVARTHGLKTHIQAELAAGFLARHNAVEIASGRLLGMDVDLVAYSASDRVLWACEMTTSGFLGKGGGNFHVGASRKFCEGYAKFSILLLKEQAAKEQIRTITGDDSISGANVQCRFVVPAGSRFIQALGWRQPTSRICRAIAQPRRAAYSRIARFCIARVC